MIYSFKIINHGADQRRGRRKQALLDCVLTVSSQAPCSGARRQNKGLDVASTAILGDAIAENVEFSCKILGKAVAE
jgi:hypothetical protein